MVCGKSCTMLQYGNCLVMVLRVREGSRAKMGLPTVGRSFEGLFFYKFHSFLVCLCVRACARACACVCQKLFKSDSF